ncbi:hypothetical protein F0U59_26810 [Archangium gephyra]|nr:hypothetical protein F0U59_26810 [Archangium gephyra]
MSEPKDLEQLVVELVAVCQEAGELGNRLTGLLMRAEELGAHPLALALVRDAEVLAYRASSHVAAGGLRMEQARRGWDVSPVGPNLAQGRCGQCLAVPVEDVLKHREWCPTLKAQGGQNANG